MSKKYLKILTMSTAVFTTRFYRRLVGAGTHCYLCRPHITSVWQKRRRFSRTTGLPGGFRSAFSRGSKAGSAPGGQNFRVFLGFSCRRRRLRRRPPSVRFPGEAPLRRRAVVGLAAAVARIPAASACVPTAPACALPAPVRVPAAFACVAAASACARAGSARSGGR